MPGKPFNQMKINRFAFSIIGLVIAGLCIFAALRILFISSSQKPPLSPIEFGHLAVPTSTNANFVCVKLTNQSDFEVFYLTEPLQVRSNGIWSGPPGPPRQRLTKLLARQSGVVVVDAASTNQNIRVPVLWGYGYNSYPPRATKWPHLMQLRDDIMGRIHGRGGRGLLYTNYLTDLKQ
jgi:hypothetical protein